MASDHIVKSFDEELVLLHQSIVRMGALSQAQLAAAIHALQRHDRIGAEAVIRRDLEADSLEHSLDARAIRVLALRQPIARDLRQVVSALRIGLEFERICDFSANIAKRTIALGNVDADTLIADISRLATLADELLGQVVGAYAERDAQRALTVWNEDERLDQAYSATYRRIVEWMQADGARVSSGTHLLFIAKNIERIGDHATNIAEAIHFQIKGEWLSEPRPKGDTTSTEPVAGQ